MCTDKAWHSPNRCLPYSTPRNKADHLAVWRRGHNKIKTISAVRNKGWKAPQQYLRIAFKALERYIGASYGCTTSELHTKQQRCISVGCTWSSWDVDRCVVHEAIDLYIVVFYIKQYICISVCCMIVKHPQVKEEVDSQQGEVRAEQDQSLTLWFDESLVTEWHCSIQDEQ